MKQKQTTPTSKILQLIFIVAIVIMTISQVAYYLLMSLQVPPDTQQTYDWVIWSFGVPTFIAVAIFFTRRDRKVSINSVFETLLLLASSLIIFGSVSTWLYQLTFFSGRSIGAFGQLLSSVFYAAPIILAVVGIATVIIYLRRKKQW